MNHEEFDALLSRTLDGELHAQDWEELSAHLLADAQACERYVQMREMDHDLRRLLAPSASDEAFLHGILNATSGKRTATQRFVQSVTERAGDQNKPAQHAPSPAPQAKPARHGTSRRLPGIEFPASRTSKRSTPSHRRVDASSTYRWPVIAAAGVLIAVVLWIALGPRGGLRQISPPVAQPDPKAREAFEKNRLAQEEVGRREEQERQARANAAHAEEERRKIQEQLVEIDRKKKEAEAQAQAQTQNDQMAKEERRKEVERLEAQEKAETERLARADAKARQAQEELVRTESERKSAEEKELATRKQAEELGRVVFVVEIKKEAAADAVPMLVRGQGAEAKRSPLTKDTRLLKGDRIETGKPGEAGGKSPSMTRQVHAALELWGGTTVDLADSTDLEVLDQQTAKLGQGLLYADISSGGETQDAQSATRAPLLITFSTQFADVKTEQARFDLRADAREALLQVAAGGAKFKNKQGEQELAKLQRSTARKDVIPTPPQNFSGDQSWKGRTGTLQESQAIMPGILNLKGQAGWRPYVGGDAPEGTFMGGLPKAGGPLKATVKLPQPLAPGRHFIFVKGASYDQKLNLQISSAGAQSIIVAIDDRDANRAWTERVTLDLARNSESLELTFSKPENSNADKYLLMGLYITSHPQELVLREDSAVHESILAYWGFDAVKRGLVYDASGHESNFRLVGIPVGAPDLPDGKHGKALAFDGVDDGLELPALAAGAAFPDSGTLAFWIKPDFNTPAEAAVFDAPENGRNHLFIRTLPKDRGLQIGFQRQSGECFFSGALKLKPDEWAHVAIVWDTQFKKGRIYLNGAAAHTQELPADNWTPNKQLLRWGAGRNVTTPFKGVLDEIGLFSKPLSADDILQLYKQWAK